MTVATLETLTAWISGFRDQIVQHQVELTELDSLIGDADHGSNMARGMEAVVAAVTATPPTDAAALFRLEA